jgi:hypothetical protein
MNNLSSIPVNLRGFPLSGNLMGTPAEGFSDWMENHIEAYVNHENPTAGARRYNQDMSIFHEEFFDALTLTEMADVVKVWDDQYGNAAQWLLDKWETEITNAEYFTMQLTSVNRVPWPIAVMKTQPNVTSFEISTLSGTSSFTQAAVVLDRYFLMYSNTRVTANALMAAQSGNIAAFDTHLMLMTFHRWPSYFNRPERLYGHSTVPKTMVDLAAAEQNTFGRLDKSEFGFSDVRAYAARVFSQVGYQLDEFFLSREDAYVMSMFNDLLVSFSKTGQGAIANRETINMPNAIGGVKISALPYISTTVHNNTDEQLLCSPVANGTLAQFRDRTRDIPSKDFRSYMRDIEYCGWDINDWARYRFIDFLSACPSFADETNDNITEGYVDTDLLKKLIADLQAELANNTVKNGWYAKTGTRLAGNEHDADPLLRFVPYASLEINGFAKKGTPNNQKQGAWYPVVLVGQLPELASARSQYLVQIYEQMYEKMLGGLDETQRAGLEAFLDGGGAPSTSVLNKLRSNLTKLSHGHPITQGEVFTYADAANSVSKLKKLTAGKKAADFATRLGEFYTTYSGLDIGAELAASAALQESTRATAAKAAIDAAVIPAESKKLLKVLLEYSAYVPEFGTSKRYSAFGERLLAAKSQSPLMQLAIYMVLLQPINLQSLRKWELYDINLPFGGKNMRFRERQMMQSIMAVASQGGKLGVYKTSGLETFVTYEGAVKDYKIQREKSSCFMIPDNKKFFWIPFVRGGPIISGCGGKGSRYFNQRQRVRVANMDAATIQGQIDGGESNFAVLGSLNEAIECKEATVLSARGFWTRGETPTRMHLSNDFSRDRNQVMFSGMLLLNFINRFSYDPSDDIYDVENLSHFEVVARRMVNYACHQGSIKMWTPSDPEFITKSDHLWGAQLPGLREREQSLLRVRQEKPSEAAEYRKKLRTQ